MIASNYYHNNYSLPPQSEHDRPAFTNAAKIKITAQHFMING